MIDKGPKHHTRMNPTIDIGPDGLVTLVKIDGGKIVKLQPVDACEQLALAKPTMRLATEPEKPAEVNPARVAWEAENVTTLRVHCQDAGISFIGKNKAALVAALTEANYAPAPASDAADVEVR